MIDPTAKDIGRLRETAYARIVAAQLEKGDVHEDDAAQKLASFFKHPSISASAIVDRGDVIPSGLIDAGGEVTHLGMPGDPGNPLMLGTLGDRTAWRR